MSPSRCHRQDVTAQPRSPAPLIVHQWSCINGRDVDGADEDISGQKGLTKAHCWPGGSWIQAPPRQTASLRAWLRGDAPPMSLLNKDPTQSLRSEARRYVGQPEAGGEHAQPLLRSGQTVLHGPALIAQQRPALPVALKACEILACSYDRKSDFLCLDARIDHAGRQSSALL